MFSLYSFFWLYFLILIWLNFMLAKFVNNRTIKGKVLDGENVLIRDYAHAVLLQVFKSDLSSHICGSSVLNQKFLLSAAHCFDIGGPIQTLAFAGHEDIRKSTVLRMALRTLVHNNFKVSSSVTNDIALIVLKAELPLASDIKRVIIKRHFPLGVTGTLVGWGLINEETLEGTEKLKRVTQKVRGKECEVIQVEHGMFCAGSLTASNPAPSRGDSGSGLITKNYQLIGILSYKINKYPALPVYTNVSFFYPWIKKITQNMYCDKYEEKQIS